MLFFSRYKAGCYDNSYYAFDPRRIGIAFHKEFLQERNKAIAKIEMEQASNREVSSNGMSREEYDKETTFRHHVQILKDSPELRKYINIVSEVTSDGKATSVLPKEQLPRIAQCVQKEYIAVL